MKLDNLFRWQVHSGDTLTFGDQALTPQSQALVVRLPFGGLVWNRPVAVIVESGSQSRRLPIVDVNLYARAAMLALSLLFAGGSLIYSALKRRE